MKKSKPVLTGIAILVFSMPGPEQVSTVTGKTVQPQPQLVKPYSTGPYQGEEEILILLDGLPVRLY